MGVCEATRTGRRSGPALGAIVALWALSSLPPPGHAADIDQASELRQTSPAVGPGPSPEAGVPCSIGQPFWEPSEITAEELPWRSVWYGHFSGGRPFVDPYGRSWTDWRDEKICFSSKSLCQSWVKALRGAYHRPEGYFTCLMLR
ncbi:hypothetical protein [Methylocapsa palsarum]|uniref:Uncharacterized protein n=1 Tax=Methylocapsa palsarum TaxID=1612308 RepID=A0A1I3Z5K7_9HYPH|nr:hypothetical protein [Methylocapsa palsarum]SFK39424.1 hypothetical protein SAMN05444581_10798 [Methylocapsa palsarum]